MILWTRKQTCSTYHTLFSTWNMNKRKVDCRGKNGDGKLHCRTFSVAVDATTILHVCAALCWCRSTFAIFLNHSATALARFAFTLAHFAFALARGLRFPAVHVAYVAFALACGLHFMSQSLALPLPLCAVQQTYEPAEAIRSETTNLKFWPIEIKTLGQHPNAKFGLDQNLYFRDRTKAQNELLGTAPNFIFTVSSFSPKCLVPQV